MKRILEPELMDDPDQALAYRNADFCESHGRRVEVFKEFFPTLLLDGWILDLGCGSGDVLFRFAKAFKRSRVVGLDGSQPMIDLANGELKKDREFDGRIQFVTGVIPGANLPNYPYQLVMSHSLLHHLHEPSTLWNAIRELAPKGCAIFVADLRRPKDIEDAHRIVDELASTEPEVLRKDFFNSLCASFKPEEIRGQLRDAGLTELEVVIVGELHLVVHGFMTMYPQKLPEESKE